MPTDTNTPAVAEAKVEGNPGEIPTLNPEMQNGFPTSIERTIDGKGVGKSLKIIWEKIKRKSSAFQGLAYPSYDVQPTKESLLELIDTLGVETVHGILKPKLDQRAQGLHFSAYEKIDKDKGIATNWDSEKNIKALADFSASTESIGDLKLSLLNLVGEMETYFDESTGTFKDPAKVLAIQGQMFIKKRQLSSKLQQSAARKAAKAAGVDDGDEEGDEGEDTK